MPNAVLIGLSSQMALRRELDSIANNIANVNTTGFKADRVRFQEHLAPLARENRFDNPDRAVRFVEEGGSWRDYGQGGIQQTGNPLDVAIDGNAFLVVQTPDGERYTRSGSLQINAQGQLVTLDGSPVMGDGGPIVLQTLDRNVSITPDGRITVLQGAEKLYDSQRSRLRLVSFANPQLLQKEGNNMYSAPDGAGLQAAGADVKVVQGAVEKSNVNSVIEMTRLIEVSRTYTTIANLLSQHNDMRKSAIERLAEVPS
ncbi:flagellar basal-body rod protein FlgF [Rhodoplanes sp. TEM]|uniref:Flagellar basal-body rod protein FlgF n=1 Tax=Rhodoplanes tepidamans TaxID=200616 RepID=A0ABT5J7B9_RHOTP|nr:MULTISPECIES: flagellar basal-body rod protein FlgF [Rhodoplanes]MDC7785548.1 flagellar basal-body rod protein FlgF [Rhodoplanes tepidamans]MDC7986170.1 flagellar basal-body rod protein FlgF [Rhodoplanes sp. TEM]MDQ0353282.1 flagellar basal-body rod protein FlgF [Rhodoplanes tepidamans]